MRDPDWNQLGHLKQSRAVDQHKLPEGESLVRGYKTCVLGATLGITEKMEARPQPPLLVPQAWTRDEGVRSCDSDLFLLSLVKLTERMLRCLLSLRG